MERPGASTAADGSRPLADFLAEVEPTPLEAATIAANLARYLASVHSGGEAFLRLSPVTVMIEPSLNVHLRSSSERGDERDLAYRAPEQMRDGEGDWRSDCWSMGALFYRLYIGEAPFRGATPEALEASILSGHVAELPVPTGVMAAEVDRILRRSLAIDPADRYPRTSDLVGDLNGLCRRLVASSSIGGGVPAADAPPVAREPAVDRSTGSIRATVADRRAEWAGGAPPSLWSVVGLPLATLFVIVALLLYCGRRTEAESANRGRNADAPVERLQDSRGG